MILIDNILISDEIIEEYFVCQVSLCKGACCWEGDYGAPLKTKEIEKITEIMDKIKPYLSEKSIESLRIDSFHKTYSETGFEGTKLHEDGSCVFMTKGEAGIAQCGFEQAYNDGKTDFKKPISCHLYPIRIKEQAGIETMNYDRWDICSAACSAGKKQKLPLFKFSKDALIRKYGEEFYEALTDAYENHKP
jgi:hypothetical protein